MLFTVYDLKGEMFEVAAHIAERLIVDDGWTLTPNKPTSPDAVFEAFEENVAAPPEKDVPAPSVTSVKKSTNKA